MKLLVTGGLGYIGSHTVVELIQNQHDVIIADNLVNSRIEVLDSLYQITGTRPVFYQIDVTEEPRVEEIFSSHHIDGVIHFAGLKAVGESVSQPLAYYENNLVCTMTLSKACLRHGVNKFVFSSSATVYGDQPSPLKEDMELYKTTNPYGETKVMSERILTDIANANPHFSISLLRYFNPVGAHESGLIGENPNGTPNNLMPYIARVAGGLLPQLNVFGDDYDTIDGTGVRDYVHVVDLAKGHVKAMEKIRQGVHIYNLGTGHGTSVLELVNTFMKVNKVDVPYRIVDRRPGDIAISYADVSLAKQELSWTATRDIEAMAKDTWHFQRKCIESSSTSQHQSGKNSQ